MQYLRSDVTEQALMVAVNNRVVKQQEQAARRNG